MNRFVAWLGEVFGTAVAGPGATVIGDPGLVRDPSETPVSPWTGRLSGLALMAAILLVAGVVPWALALPLGVLGMLYLFLDRRAARHHPRGQSAARSSRR